MTYPLHLDLAGRSVLVVGAGAVGTRRVHGLLASGAQVTVVAPQASDEVAALAEQGRLEWRQREFTPRDVLDVWLVHATTDSETVNREVAEEAERRRIWSVRADSAKTSAARTPAVAEAAGVVVSVTSGDPRRTLAVRDEISSQLQNGLASARPRRRRSRGSVVLIGGGPGDPDLITVRGRRALLSADVIVHDRLGPTSLLEEVDGDVEIIDAGKSPGRHALTQDEINAVLVDRARRGLRVARLKGGDPFVLGRGSEEMIACAAAGLPVEVVPGISSAIAGPMAAGIPVTHRGTSTGFVVISGHVAQDLSAVAATGLTTVVLMGMANLSSLVSEFRAAGRTASTPVAVIHRAFDEGQVVLSGTLDDIESQVAAAGIANPAVIVIGEVVDVLAHIAPEVLAS